MLHRLFNEQIIRRSKFRLILGEVVAVMASIWGLDRLLRQDEIGGLFIFIGGIIAFFFAYHYHRLNEPVIILDKAGITIPDFGVGKIDWADIRSITVEYRIKVGQILCLHLEDEAKYLNLQRDPSRWGRTVDYIYGFPTFNRVIEGLDMSPSQVVEEIKLYHQAATRAAQKAAMDR